MPIQESSQYQIIGKDPKGRPLQGVVMATSLREARRKAKAHPRFREATLTSVRRRKMFSYRVKHGSKVIEGSQAAYTKQEVISGLQRLGFEVKRVQRQYDFKFHAASNEIVTFIGTSARLLEQKMPYTEVLQIMATHVRDRNLKGALRDILLELKNGVDSREAFIHQSKVLGAQTALMLGIASKSGDMTAIFQNVAQLVERQNEFKKGLLSSLMLPAITSLALVGAVVFYAFYLLPRMANMVGPLVDELPPLTAWTLNASAVFRDNLVLFCVLAVGSIAGFYAYILSTKGRIQFDRYIVHVPYVGRILRNTTTELFCRVLGILYASSGENIEAIQLAAEASGNRWLTRQIRTVAVPSMLKYGTELGKALDATGFFPELFVSRFKTATETGAVKDTAIQLADYYQMENKYAMKNMVNLIELAITFLIMGALVYLTLLSSETASITVSPQ